MPQAALIVLAIVAIVCGLLAKLFGAPDFIGFALIGVGVASLIVARSTQRDLAELAVNEVIDDAKNREQFENLADRMWELQESEERFRGLIDALGDLVVHRDRDGRIVYANSVLADLLETDAEQLSGKTLAELGIEVGIVPDAAFADGECLSSTDVAIHTLSGTRWYSWIELSVRDKTSDAVSHRAIARDITARKRAEKASIAARERAEHASQAKSRFLATVSHEIRTPMNGIMGMAKLLADTDLSPEQQTYVGAVSTSSAALLALIEDLLDFSKIEAGRFELEPQPVSARELVENVVELLAARAYGKGIGLGCHVAPDVPGLITADPGRLRQVLLNLIGNAIKFTDDGGVLVSVRMEGAGPERRVRFLVSDTGPGLAPGDRARIFQEFEQADGTSTRKHGGAGLGLAISKRITEAMGGTISVESSKGKGSVFTVDLAAPEKAGAPTEPARPLDGVRVVVLSKNGIEAEAIALTVCAEGGRATVARTAEEAAEHLK
ncbi:MAG: ATP-binding protein, partial [Mesorhizobium sp.]|nr:ATP-binding protein [Mesorhizobium sp.]